MLTMRLIWPAARPSRRGPMRMDTRRTPGWRRSIRGRHGGSSRRRAGSWTTRWPIAADHHAHGQRLDPPHRRQEHGGHDDGQVVDEGRDRGRAEVAMGLEQSADHGAQADEHRAQQHDLGQADGERRRLGVEARSDDRDQPRRGEGHQGAQAGEGQDDEVDDAAGQLPALLVLAPGAVAGIDRDEGGRQGAGHDELEDGVRNAEGGQVGVKFVGGAELGADDQQADPAEHAAGDGGRRS